MGCHLWFCCSPRVSALFVGIFDVIIGVLGIALSIQLFVDSENTQLEENKAMITTADDGSQDRDVDEYRDLGLGYFFTSFLTLLVGLSILISVAKNHIRMARMAYVLNILLIVGQIGVFVVLFVLGIHWMAIFPILFFGLLQILFIFGVQNFIKNELSIESV